MLILSPGHVITTESTVGWAVLHSPGNVGLYTGRPGELSTVGKSILTCSC